MKKVECLECYEEMEEYNDWECYDKKWNDAYWDDSRKGWVCVGCKKMGF